MLFNRKLQRELDIARQQYQSMQAEQQALRAHLAVLELTPDGHIITANATWLAVMGFNDAELAAKLQGEQHSVLGAAEWVKSRAYQMLWADLKQGQAQSGTYLSINGQGESVWLATDFMPVLDEQGRVVKVLSLVKDVTATEQQSASQQAVLNALQLSSAIIEFTPDGDIITANSNFLSTMGYRQEQLNGQAHKLFCEPEFYQQQPYFWQELAKGEYKAGRFKRLGAQGQEVWLEASYNPILDASGKVVRVMKFASDITARVQKAQQARAAAEVASVTAIQTASIADRGYCLLEDSVSISSQIADDLEQSMTVIQSLNEQARQIEEIVATISSVADQTNLLALNAAIEAARAGEQGRGFAVVADEVRKLAGRTSLATTEIGQVVAQNRALTVQVSTAIGAVTVVAEQGKQQVLDVEAIMAEIQQGALAVQDAVAELS
ncbi:methyl-accepting chemotaxis protein [Oceanisphaera sp. W20_SRM_FM3]|uniref:methyl-accepting chemotaxis protein n=1 Tax=Oceanisphaera sp. W20_SRM_FM3 TaxID=3240267 RepID=UPI003F945623